MTPSFGSQAPSGRRPRIWLAAGTALFTLLVQGDAAFAQRLGQGSDDGIAVWRVVAAFLLCTAVAAAAAFVLKFRLGTGTAIFRGIRRSRRLQLVESLKIGHQVNLCIVACDGEEFLMTSSAQGANLLPMPSRSGGDAQAGRLP